MSSPILTIDTPAGPVPATAGHRQDDAVTETWGRSVWSRYRVRLPRRDRRGRR